MLKLCIRRVCIVAAIFYISGCAVTNNNAGTHTKILNNGDGVVAPVASSQGEIPDVLTKEYRRAIWLAKAERIDESIQLFNEITKNNPNFARAYTNLGLLHIQENDLLAAEQALTQAIKLQARDAVALNHLGVVFRKLGKFNHAKIAYLSAIKYNSEYAEAYYNLGILNDIYLYKLEEAHSNYKTYLSLITGKNTTVEKWILDLSRRIAKQNKIVNGSKT